MPTPGHTNDEVRDAIRVEIERLKTSDVTDDELAMFKTRAKADVIRGLGNNAGLAAQLAICLGYSHGRVWGATLVGVAFDRYRHIRIALQPFGLTLQHGRLFDEHDTDASPPVVVINGHYHEKLDTAKVDELLDGLK